MLPFTVVIMTLQVAAQSGWIDLDSDAGVPFVGHQFEFLDRDESGVFSTKEPVWVSLYRTEGRPFFLRGEVFLGGHYQEMLYLEDLPDGFSLWLREWSGVKRYQLDSRRMMVKRTLLEGEELSGIAVIHQFPDPQTESWVEFEVRASKQMIEFTFGDHYRVLEGPLVDQGANKIVIAPGTRLRNLQLQIPGNLVAEASPLKSEAVAAESPQVFEEAPLELGSSVHLVNPGFDKFSTSKERGVFGEHMFGPGSMNLTGWSIDEGAVGFRESRRSGGGFVLELGPRNQPGCVSQTFATVPGKRYQLSLDVCTGRAQHHFNRTVRIKVGDLNTLFNCPVGARLERNNFVFTASESKTKLSLCAGGDAGFGPVIDNVAVNEIVSSLR